MSKNGKLHTLKALLILLASVILSNFSPFERLLAQSQGGQLSLLTDPNTPSQNKAYFVYEVDPGEIINDAILITNFSEARQVALVLYAADASTASSGGLNFSDTLTFPQKTGQWLQLPDTQIDLMANEQVRIPFQVQVPVSASPGEYVAGIVVQERSVETVTTSGVSMNLVPRSALAVIVRVRGLEQKGLEIGDITANVIAGRQMIVINMHNSGNVGLKPEIIVDIRNLEGQLVKDYSTRLGYFISNDSIKYEYSVYPPLPAGEYDVQISMRDSNILVEETVRLTLSNIDSVPVIRGNDEPIVRTEPESFSDKQYVVPEEQPTNTENFSLDTKLPNNLILMMVIGISGVLLCVIGLTTVGWMILRQ